MEGLGAGQTLEVAGYELSAALARDPDPGAAVPVAGGHGRYGMVAQCELDRAASATFAQATDGRFGPGRAWWAILLVFHGIVEPRDDPRSPTLVAGCARDQRTLPHPRLPRCHAGRHPSIVPENMAGDTGVLIIAVPVVLGGRSHRQFVFMARQPPCGATLCSGFD